MECDRTVSQALVFDPWQQTNPEIYSSLALSSITRAQSIIWMAFYRDLILHCPWSPELYSLSEISKTRLLIALPTQGGWLAASLTQALAWRKQPRVYP